MPKIPEIEGLRGWLAWAVVASHLPLILNIQWFGVGMFAPALGAWSVQLFILVSGFVISGLVIDKQERWSPFIIRRAFRIFPAYLVALALGAAFTPLAIEGLARAAWASDPLSWYWNSTVERHASTLAHPVEHWALHLTLLQGLVPNDVLPWSSVTLLGPAWSLSLEWQFYLIAPALVWAMRSRTWAPWLVLAAFISAELYRRGVFGEFGNYSSLLGGLWWFIIGMATRLSLPWLQKTAIPLAPTVFAAFGLCLVARDLTPVFIWIAFAALLSRPAPEAPLDQVFRKMASKLLASKTAMAAGARSYSVYVIHIPIMNLLVYLMPLDRLNQWEALIILTLAATGLTVIASELLYRYVEQPTIRLGARLAANADPPKSVRSRSTDNPEAVRR